MPGLLRTDPLARFSDDDLLVHRLDSIGLEPSSVDAVVMSHLHFDHAGGASLFPKSELIVQQDEYAYAHHPASFFASFYYRKNFDLPGYRWRLLDGDTEVVPGVAGVGSHHSRRRLRLLAGAHRQGARPRCRLEPHPGAPLDQAAQDHRPPHPRPDLPGPRSRLLADRQAGARRLPVNEHLDSRRNRP
ncbi:MAG: MBL fold metallo-hydrolase [Candidatus Rokubacteria bacterium]|nr:MBL fold metallo-hydrolase [Candidatus Rokubacteria bacterium]